MDLSVIIVNYNTAHLLSEAITCVRDACAGLAVEILVVDNASSDNSLQVLQGVYPDIELMANQQNVGFGRANNQAVSLISGRYVLLLNTDAFIRPDTLIKSIACMNDHSACGILGVKLVGRDGALQPSCRYFPTPWNSFLSRAGLARFAPATRMVDDLAWDHASLRECDWVPGCYYLVRREVIEQVGLFDPRFFMYYEEVDHCRRAKEAGWKVLYFPDTAVVHLGGESAKSVGELTSGRQLSALQIESELLYFRKHHGLAGVWLGVVLGALADLVLAAKWVVRRHDLRGTRPFWRNMGLTVGLFARTAWGSRSTR